MTLRNAGLYQGLRFKARSLPLLFCYCAAGWRRPAKSSGIAANNYLISGYVIHGEFES
jgi:hypothetical protein